MNDELKQVEDAKGHPGKLRALADKRFNPESSEGLSAAVEAAWKDPAQDPMTAFWGMQLASKAGNRERTWAFAKRAVANKLDHELTHAVLTFLRERDSNSNNWADFIAELLKHDPYRIGMLALQTHLSEAILKATMTADGMPIARLAQAFMVEGDRFNVLDAGATESNMANEFAAWSKDSWRVFGFDPSKSAVLGDSTSNIVMSPIGLGASEGEVTFYEAANGGASSIHPLEPEFAKRMQFSRDVTLAQSLEIVDTYEVDVIDIDTWRMKGNFPPIDYIKINTQGSELDILRGAKTTLRTLFGIVIEVPFAGHYKGGPGFGEIDSFLNAASFCLFDIRKTNTFQRVRHRKSIANHFGPRTGNYAWPSRQALEAQLLYLRDPTHPSEHGNPVWDDLRSWLMLGVIAEIHGQLDFAVQLLEIVLHERPALLGARKIEFAKYLNAIVNVYNRIEMRHY